MKNIGDEISVIFYDNVKPYLYVRKLNFDYYVCVDDKLLAEDNNYVNDFYSENVLKFRTEKDAKEEILKLISNVDFLVTYDFLFKDKNAVVNQLVYDEIMESIDFANEHSRLRNLFKQYISEKTDWKFKETTSHSYGKKVVAIRLMKSTGFDLHKLPSSLLGPEDYKYTFTVYQQGEHIWLEVLLQDGFHDNIYAKEEDFSRILDDMFSVYKYIIKNS